MSALEWLVLAGAAGALLALLMCLANLALLRRPRANAAARPQLAVSVCIPARDEAVNIEACVRAALAGDHPDLEVLVYDDESRDGTRALVERLAREDPRCRLATPRPLPPGWNGKQHACAALAQEARGAWLLFTDADVRLAPNAVRRALDFALRSGAALVSTFPRQRIGSCGELLIVPMMFFLLLSYLPLLLMRRTCMRAASAGCGQFLLAERAAYRASGGHAAFGGALHDGIRLPRAFRERGFHTDLFDGTDLAEVRMYRGLRAAWCGFSKDAYEGVGSPGGLVALSALHLVAHVAPWAALPALALAGGSPRALACAALAVGAGALERLLLARRFRHSAWLALLHPLTVALMIALQWRSAWLHWTGRRTWRGRASVRAAGTST